MLLSNCCCAHIIIDTESEGYGVCSRCLELSKIWDDTYMNLRNMEHKIVQKKEAQDAEDSAKPIRKRINKKLGKNQAVIYYNNKIFEFTKRQAAMCTGCFFSSKKICPKTYNDDFPCGTMILKLIKL